MPIEHKNLAAGKWQTLSLSQQLGNIGSEVSRAIQWRGRDEKSFSKAVERALELFDFTLQDARWRGRLKEPARARELLCDTVLGRREYNDSLENLDAYFFQFALAARLRH